MRVIIKQVSIFVFGVCTYSMSPAQTGPGGVGNSSNVDLWIVANRQTLTSSNAQATNNQSVETWSDISGNGNNLTQTTSAQQPTFLSNQLNGMPAIDFNGSSNYLAGSLSSGFSASNVFLVSSFDNATQGSSEYDYVVSFGTPTSGMSIGRWRGSGGTPNRYFSTTEGIHRKGPTITTTNYQIYNQEFSNAAPFHFLRINNSSQSVAAHGGSISIGTDVTLGNYFNSVFSNHFDGKVCELIFYDQVLNVTQRNIIHNYLAASYNLTISNDKYVHQAAHGNDVAGIGRESAADLHSDSRGSGIVRINSASGLANGEYMLWGHNGANNSANSTEVPASYTVGQSQRLNKEWRVDISGGDNTVGTVTIIFDLSSAPSHNFGINPSEFRILIDSDGNFTNATVDGTAPTSTAGNQIRFDGITLSDNDFFTLGNSNVVTDCASLTTANWPSVIWTCGSSPDSTNNVIISDGTAVTIAGTESANDLFIETDGGGGGGSLTLSANATLIVKGDLTVGSGASFTFGTDSRLILRGVNGTQTFDNSSGSAITMYDFEINNPNGVVLTTGAGSSNELANGLTLTNGNLLNDGRFTFLSDATRTAHVNAVPNGSVMVGSQDYTVQRFRGARGADWGDISSSGVDTDIEDLDNEIFTSGIIGGDGYASNTLGGGFISMYTWNENGSPDDYVAVANTNQPFEIGRGYETFLADNLSVWNAQAWDLNGTVSLAPLSIPVNSTPGDNWNLLGNPYLGFLDWDHITANSGGIVNNEYWAYDADLNVYVNVVAGGGATVVPGQGFWVVTTGITNIDLDPSVDLVSNENTSNYMKRSLHQEQLMVRLKNEDNPYGSAVYLRKDNNAFVGKDEFDLSPLRLPDPKACHMAIANGADESMVNYVPTTESSLEIPISLESGMTGAFSLNFTGLNKFAEYECISLVDQQTGEKIELFEDASYPLTIDQANSKMHYTLLLSNSDAIDCEIGSAVDSEKPVHIWATNGQINADFYLDRSMSASIDIYNTIGQHVHHQESNVGYTRESIQLSQPSGVYFVTVALDGYTTTEKIILN